ncbi:MAG TPA: hypothetical protein VLH12_02295 [Usitatibacter sp.]|nr:hypothetical protein [Usitatibacter sp.]
MNTRIIKQFAGAFTLALSGAALAQLSEPPVKVNTDGLAPYVREHIEAKALEGRTSVIQYINRTRMIHHLRAEQVLPAERPAAVIVAKDEKMIVERAETPRK